MEMLKLSRQIHQDNVDKGFWDHDRPQEEIRVLIVSEIIEAMEEVRSGRPQVYHVNKDGAIVEGMSFDGHKPEGEAIELADAAIRIMDYIGFIIRIKPDLCLQVEDSIKIFDVTLDKNEMFNYFYLASMVYESNSAPDHLLSAVFSFAKAKGIDLEPMIEAKLAYNRTRPHKHGKQY